MAQCTLYTLYVHAYIHPSIHPYIHTYMRMFMFVSVSVVVFLFFIFLISCSPSSSFSFYSFSLCYYSKQPVNDSFGLRGNIELFSDVAAASSFSMCVFCIVSRPFYNYMTVERFIFLHCLLSFFLSILVFISHSFSASVSVFLYHHFRSHAKVFDRVGAIIYGNIR